MVNGVALAASIGGIVVGVIANVVVLSSSRPLFWSPMPRSASGHSSTPETRAE